MDARPCQQRQCGAGILREPVEAPSPVRGMHVRPCALLLRHTKPHGRADGGNRLSPQHSHRYVVVESTPGYSAATTIRFVNRAKQVFDAQAQSGSRGTRLTLARARSRHNMSPKPSHSFDVAERGRQPLGRLPDNRFFSRIRAVQPYMGQGSPGGQS